MGIKVKKSIDFSNESINRKMKFIVGNHSSRILYSLGVGGFLTLYIIVFFRMNIVPNLIGTEELYKFFINMQVASINPIEINILIISMIAIIVAPLLSNKDIKRRLQDFFLVNLIIFELICIMSVIINQEITNLFIIGTTITAIYLVWVTIEALERIRMVIVREKTNNNHRF